MNIQITAKAPEEQLVQWAVEFLQYRGYSVFLPDDNGKWETPSQCAARVGLHPFTVTKRLHRWERMGNNLPVRSGRTGRIIEFQSNPRFDEFLTK